MSATLLQLAFVILSQSAGSPEAPLTQLPFGLNSADFSRQFAKATRPATPTEEHDQSNGFGIAKRAMPAKLLAIEGEAFALFGRKTAGFVGVTWSPSDQSQCKRVSKSLRDTLGKPSDIAPAMKQASWEESIESVDVTLTQHGSTCSVLLLAAEPWDF